MAIFKKTTKSSSTSSSSHPTYLQPLVKTPKLLSAQLNRLVNSEKIVKTKNTYKMCAKPGKADPVSSTKKESKTKTEMKKAKFAVGVESVEKRKNPKMKRLSQVKTPEAMKKRANLKRTCQVKTPESTKKNEKREKMKRLSQVKTPEAMKKKTVYRSTPAPKKVGTKK